jgi:hypothetical protein
MKKCGIKYGKHLRNPPLRTCIESRSNVGVVKCTCMLGCRLSPVAWAGGGAGGGGVELLQSCLLASHCEKWRAEIGAAMEKKPP